MDTTTTYRLRWPDGREFGPATMRQLAQWVRERRVPDDGVLLPTDGGAPLPVRQCPELAAILDAPPVVPPSDHEPLAGLIPYKNPQALTGYYISIFSLLPILGLLAGPAAIVLGVLGLRARRREPHRRGAAHAWIAIILGSIGTLISLGCGATLILIAIAGASTP